MEVVHRGELPQDRQFKGTCNTCGSVVKAKQSELKASNDGRNGTDYSAKCPVCGVIMYFDRV